MSREKRPSRRSSIRAGRSLLHEHRRRRGEGWRLKPGRASLGPRTRRRACGLEQYTGARQRACHPVSGRPSRPRAGTPAGSRAGSPAVSPAGPPARSGRALWHPAYRWVARQGTSASPFGTNGRAGGYGGVPPRAVVAAEDDCGGVSQPRRRTPHHSLVGRQVHGSSGCALIPADDLVASGGSPDIGSVPHPQSVVHGCAP